MIPQPYIDEIKNHIDIVDVVSDFVQLKRSGSSFKALSPFTSEKTPSFFVSPSKQIFKCFSSGKAGDAISFIMEIEGLSYPDTLRYLAKKYGISIQESNFDASKNEDQNKREGLFLILKFAKNYFKKQLFEHPQGKNLGLTYIKERGFSDEVVSKFELGFAIGEWDGFLKAAEKKHFNKKLLEEAGLIIQKENKSYDRFRERIIFPIFNTTGYTLGFGARILQNKPKQPKYINSPETEIYHKSHVLYGLFQSKESIRKENNCYLVEGYTDVLTLHQMGIENVVSTCGTALTSEQVNVIKRYTQQVTLLFDGDDAGIRASLRGIDVLFEGDINIKGLSMPKGEDPDSYAKKLNPEAFRTFLKEESQDIIHFIAYLELKGVTDDPTKKAEVIENIIGKIAKIANPIKRTLYIQETSKILNMSEELLVAALNKQFLKKNKVYQLPPQKSNTLADSEESTILKAIEIQEEECIRLLLNYANIIIDEHNHPNVDLAQYLSSELSNIQFVNPTYKKIYQWMVKEIKQNNKLNLDVLLSESDETTKKTIFSLQDIPYEISPNWEKKFDVLIPNEKDYLKNVTFTNILRFKFRVVRQMLFQEKEKLKNENLSENKEQYLDEIMRLKKIEMQLAKLLGNVII